MRARVPHRFAGAHHHLYDHPRARASPIKRRDAEARRRSLSRTLKPRVSSRGVAAGVAVSSAPRHGTKTGRTAEITVEVTFCSIREVYPRRIGEFESRALKEM